MAIHQTTTPTNNARKTADMPRRRDTQLMQEFQPLCNQLTAEKVNPCQVANKHRWEKVNPDEVPAGRRKAGKKAELAGFLIYVKEDRNRRVCLLGRKDQNGPPDRRDDGDLPAN